MGRWRVLRGDLFVISKVRQGSLRRHRLRSAWLTTASGSTRTPLAYQGSGCSSLRRPGCHGQRWTLITLATTGCSSATTPGHGELVLTGLVPAVRRQPSLKSRSSKRTMGLG